MSSERRASKRMVDELRATLTGGTYERYGPVRPVRRDGIGGHWRSYSTPPPSSGDTASAEVLEEGEWQGHNRVLSEGYDQAGPLRSRGGLPVFDEGGHAAESTRGSSAPPPSLHIIHPSISAPLDDPSIYPPQQILTPALDHFPRDHLPSSAEAGDRPPEHDQASHDVQAEVQEDDTLYISQEPTEGRSQTTRRNRVGPGGIISKIASRSSFSKSRIAFAPPPSQPEHLHPTRHSRLSQRQPSPSPSAKRDSSASYVSHRPAPPPPLLLSPTPNRFALSSARVPSPAPSATPAHSRAPTPLTLRDHTSGGGLMNGVSPGRSSIWGKEEGMVEIPRCKKRELNLGIVGGNAGQRMAWGVLWAGWIIAGLLSIFFDVNVLYMLIQCAQNPSTSPDSASARTWVFAIAAYAICWIISIFGVWIGWELWFEFWRRWRMPRPAIEPLHTSLPATLHLSLTSFRHFTFFLYVRLSPLHTPHAIDIVPETAHLAVQNLPALAPILPRASLATVLLVAFSNGDEGLGSRDAAFWEINTGRLTAYSHGVLLAFVSIIAFRILLILISAIALWVFSRPRRPTPSRFRSRFDSFSTTSLTDTRPTTPDAATRPRDPADTQSPAKGWMAESDLKWEWRERGRNRLQDAFELCMIRRPRSSAGPSTAYLSRQVSPTRQGGQSVPLGPLSSKEVGENKENEEETILTPRSTDPFMRFDPSQSRSTIRFAAAPPSPSQQESDETTRPGQARPESELEPIQTPRQPPRVPIPPTPTGTARQSTSSLDPRSALGALAAARQSVSSQDLFYTPMSRTPATERTGSQAEVRETSSGSGSASALGAAGASTSTSSPTPTPPSAYRRPAAPGPGPSTAGTSLLTLGGRLDGRDRRDAAEEVKPSDKDQSQGREGVAGSPIQDNRVSTETTSGESMTDDSAALLSQSSTPTGNHAPTSVSSHLHNRTTSDSLRRASQVFRERSQSLVSRLRERSGSLNGGGGGSDQGHVGSVSSSRRGSYATLMEKGEGGVSEFGKAEAVGKLGRTRSTSVGLLKEKAGA